MKLINRRSSSQRSAHNAPLLLLCAGGLILLLVRAFTYVDQLLTQSWLMLPLE